MPTAGDIMDDASALLNDVSQTKYTYTAQLPYLNIALREFGQKLEKDNVPVTNEVSTSIVVTAGVVAIGFATSPALPADLIDIRRLWERLNGSSEDYIPMVHKTFLPGYVTPTASLVYWVWQDQELRFIEATSDRQLRLDYISNKVPVAADENTEIGIINSQTFLGYKTAALCAQFIGENKERSDDLNILAQLALDDVLTISSKGRQNISVRRRPFRASYKGRNVI